MPPGTKLRNLRVADALWVQALAVSKERNETLSDVIRDALRRYVARHTT